MASPPLSRRPSPPRDHTATCLETDEDVMQSLRANLAGVPLTPPRAMPVQVPVLPTGQPTAAPLVGREAIEPRPGSVSVYAPSLRPPMAVLTIFDDGTTNEGERVRLRDSRFVIGRSEGDLLIPHDSMISGRHVEITRQQVHGQHRWVITDLQSTNGLFVRVLRTPLTDRSEVLIGKGRYRFLSPTNEPPPTVDQLSLATARNSTQAWDGGDSPSPSIPYLVEMIGNGLGARVLLTRSEYWIGSDPACAIHRIDDPFCDARHARLSRSSTGNWMIENNRALNGLWFRIPQVVAETTVLFQVGEQRFRLQVIGQ